MAINVNTVYQTVLLLLNKEQRGYITPNEFNKIATQVQLEIFEQYFEDLNQQLRGPGLEDEYADRVDNIEEKISIFKAFGQVGYYNYQDPANPVINEPYFYLPADVHRIGTIMYKEEQQLQMTNRGEYLRLNMSKLTRPTTNYPMYIQEGNITTLNPLNTLDVLCENCIRIYVYPNEIIKDVSVSYIRKPLDVIWAYSIGNLGQYIWDRAEGSSGNANPTTGSVDFEIDSTEQTEVIIRILMYSGVVIRDPQIIQAAAAQAQATEVNQKS